MNEKIRKFNDEGIISFQEMLTKFIESKTIDLIALKTLLSDDGKTIVTDFDLPSFKSINKLEVAKKISDSLRLNENSNLYYEGRLWTWLAAYLLDSLVPMKKGTKERDFRETALYILESNNWKKYYRHLLSFPCWIFAELGEKGAIFLRGEIYERGEIVEQLASVNDIQRNKSIVEAATLLFYNPVKKDIYKGVASKNQGGTARRFRDVIQQFKLTFDLNAMNGSQIVKIMPFEFAKWSSAS